MESDKNEWTRRKFLSNIAGAGAAVAFSSLASWGMPNTMDSKVAAIIAKYICIDTHNHIDVPLDMDELPGPDIALANEMKRAGLSAICMTFAVDYHKEPSPIGFDYSRFIAGLDAMDTVLKKNDMKRALNLKDIENAHTHKQPIVIQSVEGCHFMEGKIERVDEAYNRGLRHLGLLHDSDAMVPLGDVYTNKPQFGGLTDLGAQTIKECNRLGILVDLAHADNNTINGALKVAAHPVLISHTGLDTQLGKNPQMAQMMRKRLISKEQAKIVADAGGVIGVWTHLADTPLEFAENIRALADIIGVDHVCIGTDTKLTPPYRSPKQQNDGWGDGPKKDDKSPKKNLQQHKDNNPPQKHKRIGERTNEAWAGEKEGFYYVVIDAMLKIGFSEDEIGKIAGGNYLRLFKASTMYR